LGVSFPFLKDSVTAPPLHICFLDNAGLLGRASNGFTKFLVDANLAGVKAGPMTTTEAIGLISKIISD